LPAQKAERQSLRRNLRNRSVRRTTRGAVNAARVAVEETDSAAAATAVRHAISTLDRAVKKGIMHKNTASRSKSRLAVRLNKMGQGGS